MPNHVINEVIFRGLDAPAQYRILDLVVNRSSPEAYVDFSILLPIPLNVWMGNTNSVHGKTFPGTALDWATANWGTKWNAYGHNMHILRTGDMLILRFRTAWRPPYGWLVAVLNKSEMSFDHNWLSEGEGRGHCGEWLIRCDGPSWMNGPEWTETEADEDMHRHLHLLLWGVEEFPPDEEEAPAEVPA